MTGLQAEVARLQQHGLERGIRMEEKLQVVHGVQFIYQEQIR